MKKFLPITSCAKHLLPSFHPNKAPKYLASLCYPNENPSRESSYWKHVLSRLLQEQKIKEAREVFAKIEYPDVHLFTMMIKGLSKSNCFADAFKLFDNMPVRDVAAWNSILKAYLDSGDLNSALELFHEMPERNVISSTTMINGLAQFGRIDAAERLFLRMPQRDTASWNAMISGYLINGEIVKARKTFEQMPSRNVISWTAIIGGYEQNGLSKEALELFKRMWHLGIKPTSSTYACSLTACAKISNLMSGTQIHAQLIKSSHSLDSYVTTSLLTLYAKCQKMDLSISLFNESSHKTVVTWTALITGYNENNKYAEALNEFTEMVSSGMKPNQSTFTSVLNSCSGLEALDCGKRIHATTVKISLDLDAFVGNSLVVMYSKCGNINESLMAFENICERNLVSWNSVIVGCAQNGYASLAFKLFDEMNQCLVQPDAITYVGLLMACSHVRMHEKGRYYFEMLKRDPSVEIRMEHYACMVDILGRCGKLGEAEQFIRNMPLRPNVAVWLALLGACRVHGNVEVAEKASKEIFNLDLHNSSAYVLLSNIYATAGRWNDVVQTRVVMRDHRVDKVIGCSWITIRDVKHEFVSGDRSHPMIPEIYKNLEWLGTRLMEYGYVYDKRSALHDVDDEQKEALLTYHSEKIALAFGLLSTVEGSTIRIMKNLRQNNKIMSFHYSNKSLMSSSYPRELT
ncbi:Pentatricopeptide repeat-containing protein [Rhynchospora pubera]|uniref:Pentatricopeptide repeat-containing protein n=1 Tax=Rhynchospora pubera TaxID=906938 RepID=A0AAV8HPR2_9POAL|nr:Pentatricopeptide repeat-containing protein [Rhynchospora pubera]